MEWGSMKVSRSRSSSNTFYQKWKKGEPFRVLLIGWLFFALTLALMMYAGLYWSGFGAIVAVGAPLCFAFGTFVAVKGRIESIVLAFLTFVLGIIAIKILQAIERSEIDPKRRPETLTISEFNTLCNFIKESM